VTDPYRFAPLPVLAKYLEEGFLPLLYTHGIITCSKEVID
jgi:hypothetical protein